jgi:hypothetical protein
MLALSCAVLLFSASPSCDTSAASREAARSSVSADLERKGYTLSKGVFVCVEESGAKGAGNPESNTCYVQFNRTMQGAPTLPANDFQLAETDVLLYMGCAPAPPGPMYYGFSPYLSGFTLADTYRGRPTGQMGDSLNHLVMNSSRPGLPWGLTQTILFTSDTKALADAREALSKLTMGQRGINTIPIPSAQLHMGHGIDRNYFLLGARAGPFANAAERHKHAISAQVSDLNIFLNVFLAPSCHAACRSLSYSSRRHLLCSSHFPLPIEEPNPR